MTPLDPLSVAVLVARMLDELEIPYVIGGSVASSLHGEPRSTLDLDLMIEAGVEKTRALAGLLRPSYAANRAVHHAHRFGTAPAQRLRPQALAPPPRAVPGCDTLPADACAAAANATER